MGEEKDLRFEPDEVRTSRPDEDDDVEGHLRTGVERAEDSDSEDPDVEGHLRV
jgi:hypothetical protein